MVRITPHHLLIRTLCYFEIQTESNQMNEIEQLEEFVYGLDGFEDAVTTRTRPTTFSPASRNLIPDEENTSRAFKGLDHIGNGARRMFLAGDTWAGLADTGGQDASGSLFSWFADMLVFAGYGQVVYDGSPIAGVFASAIPQMLLRWGGSYTAPKSGPFQIGLPQPDAPRVGVIDSTLGGVPQTAGAYSFKIAWVRLTTGGRSVSSPTSASVVAVGKAVYLVVGDAPDGATHLAVFVTKTNFAGRGLHYRLVRANPFTSVEYTVDDIEREIADCVVTNGSPIVTSAAGSFTVGDLGKRFAPISAGFSVPAGTTVLSIDSPTQITLSNNVTVTSGTNPRRAELISYVGGFDRGILLNWQESDLIDEIAWIEDYPPDPGSGVFPLEKVLGVITDGDSLDPASGTNRGCAVQFSLPNLPESFNPLHRLYLPQKVVDVQHRGLDSYVFIGSQNFVGALQYVPIDGTAPATLTSLLPDEGILSRNNWCLTDAGLYLFTTKGSAKRIIQNGVVDDQFSRPVRRWMKRWTDRERVVVAKYGDGLAVAYIYGSEVLLYNTQTQKWSARICLNDHISDIEVVSGLNVQGRLLLTGEAASVGAGQLLFDFDHESGTGSPVAAIPHFVPGLAKDLTKVINYLGPKFNADNTAKKAFVTLHVNDELTYIEDGTMTLLSNNLSSASAKFTSKFLGKYVLVARAGAGGDFLRGRIIEIVSPTQVRLGTCERILASAAPLNPTSAVQNAFCVFAHRIYEFTAGREGLNAPSPLEIFENGIRTFAVGIVMTSDGGDGVPLGCSVYGGLNRETNWQGVK